jgi:hypothetical protein
MSAKERGKEGRQECTGRKVKEGRKAKEGRKGGSK